MYKSGLRERGLGGDVNLGIVSIRTVLNFRSLSEITNSLSLNTDDKRFSDGALNRWWRREGTSKEN